MDSGVALLGIQKDPHMNISEQLAILIFLTLLNCFIHPTFPAALVFVSAIALSGLIAYITKSDDKRIVDMQSEIHAMKEKLSSMSLTMGLRK